MISKMIPGDVFSDTLQEGEASTYIACGINTGGFNDPEGNSVAGRIGREYTPEFVSLGDGKIGQVRIREFNFHGRIAQALGIVCNEQTPGNWHSENSSNCSQAGKGVLEGFTKINELLTSNVSSYNIDRELASKVGKIITPTAPRGTLIQPEIEEGLIVRLEELISQSRAKLNPIVRSVLIGSGVSGSENDANVAEILKAMQESPANIHLYLQAEEQMAQVARVIPSFPDVGALAAVEGYDDIRRAA